MTGGAVRMAASGDSELDDMQFTRDGKTMVYTQQTGSRRSRFIAASSSGRNAVGAHAPERPGPEQPAS